MTPAYTAGCQLAASGKAVATNVGGPNTAVLGAPNLATGKTTAIVNATNSKGTFSQLAAREFFFVGPAISGCYTPSTTRTVFANFTWNITLTPHQYVYCNATGGTVSATGSIVLYANIHFYYAPYYVTSPSPTRTAWSHGLSLNCTVAKTGTYYAPGPIVKLVTVPLGPVTLTGGVSYDFFSSIWENQTASTPKAGDIAWSHDNVSATLSKIVCSC